METEVQFTDFAGFEYGQKTGDTATAEFITLHEPRPKHAPEMARLRQAMVIAVQDRYSNTDSDDDADDVDPADEKEKEGEDEDDTEVPPPLVILNMLAAAPGVDLAKVYGTAKGLILSKGVALVDGETQLTQALWDKMSGNEVELLMGTYIGNFIKLS